MCPLPMPLLCLPQDLKILREHLDNSPGHQLQARTWLIHWALFIFFNHPDGRDGIIDMFFQDKYGPWCMVSVCVLQLGQARR